MICGPAGSKSRLAEAVGAEVAAQSRQLFWKFRCRKIARRRGAKHVWNSKRRKHTMRGAL